jgi:WD40 repeat protein
VDWNQDGKKDLIVGDSDGQISIFLNTNTDDAPVFAASAKLLVSGSTFDCGLQAAPFVVDWNNDGKKDVLCGNDVGRVILLANEGTNAAPLFPTYSYLRVGAGFLDAGGKASPLAIDWNGDGKKDLICGCEAGTLLYYENTGTDAGPAFSGSARLQAGGSDIDVGYYSRPAASDWNGDGKTDLLVGNDLGMALVFLAVNDDTAVWPVWSRYH